jgi:hypothetical protein
MAEKNIGYIAYCDNGIFALPAQCVFVVGFCYIYAGGLKHVL